MKIEQGILKDIFISPHEWDKMPDNKFIEQANHGILVETASIPAVCAALMGKPLDDVETFMAEAVDASDEVIPDKPESELWQDRIQDAMNTLANMACDLAAGGIEFPEFDSLQEKLQDMVVNKPKPNQVPFPVDRCPFCDQPLGQESKPDEPPITGGFQTLENIPREFGMKFYKHEKEPKPMPDEPEPEFEFEWQGKPHKIVDKDKSFECLRQDGWYWHRVCIEDRPKDFLAKVLPWMLRHLDYRKEWRRK